MPTTKLGPDEIKDWSRLTPLRSSLAIAGDWALILAAFWMARSSHPLVWAAAFALAARQQHALAVLMHEAAHFRLAKSKSLNDAAGFWLCSAPLLFSLFSYRHFHLTHHRDPQSTHDPDLAVTGGYPVSKASFRRKLTRDLTGRTYPKFVRFYNAAVPTPPPGWARRPAIAYAGVNLVIGTAATLLGGPAAYLLLWVVPMFFLLPAILRLRAIAEHAGLERNDDQSLSARTVVHWAQCLLFSPHQVNFHVEHHLYPSVPFYRLAAFHRLLGERGMLRETNVFRSYLKVWRGLVR